MDTPANNPALRSPDAYVRESHLLARMPLLYYRLSQNHTALTRRAAAAPSATPTPEEVIDHLRRTARTLTYHHPTKTLEVAGGELPIRITG